MSTPGCSVIVPCFNQGNYLDDCLTSVFLQTYHNWECIIIDDGSVDDTEKIAAFWLKKDNRFKYFYQDNRGLPAARNYGIENSSGDYILPLDADDKIGAQYVELGVTELVKDTSLTLIYCKAEKFGVENGHWELMPFSLFNLGLENMIFTSAIFRRRDFLKTGGYDKNMTYGWEDWDLWISLLKYGGKVKQLDTVQFYYRTRDVSMLKSISRTQEEYLYKYLSIKHADFYVEQFGSFPSLVNQNLKKELELARIKTSWKIGFKIFLKNLTGRFKGNGK